MEILEITIVCVIIALTIAFFIWQIIHDEVSPTLTQQEKDDMSYTAEYMKGLRK